MEFNLSEELEGMEILAILFSPTQLGFGIFTIGENYNEGAIQPIIRVYLLGFKDAEWYIEDELQAFAFLTFQGTENLSKIFRICQRWICCY